MANRKHIRWSRRLPCLSALLLFCTALLYAQEAEPSETVYDEGDFFIGWNDGGPRFIQRLSWNHNELALRYEVILEETLDGKHTELLRQSTRENSLLVSLRPGHYRYQVRVYNLLSQLEYTMPWTAFEVFNALQPRIDRFSPVEYILDTETQWEITITGTNIAAEADIRLRPQGGNGPDIRPQTMTIEGNSVRLVFNDAALSPGSYNVYIRNPGGLEDVRGTFTIHPRKAEETTAGDRFLEPEQPVSSPGSRSFDIRVAAGYAPVLPLYGILFDEGAFEGPFFPLGFAGRVGFIPFKWGRIEGFSSYIGAELDLSWNKLDEQKEAATLSAQFMGVRIRALYQLWLPNRTMAINACIGAGIGVLRDFYFDYGNGRDDSLSSAYLSLDGGLSVQWRITGPLYIEAGADFTHILSFNDRFQPGYIRPAVNLVWQF
ncbi:hypothetical protein FACS1894142_5600 [Spirochaetia bacterium]|nr:hypothetical protein FACS1894142_5600 [Spirochaetia bacterium]